MKFRSLQWAAVLLALALTPSLSWAAIDSDGDGVPDDQDECPQTPPKTSVDKKGCPIKNDKDHDGVVDEKDDCPDTPTGAKVDIHGCALDEDSDGVPDGIDQCPHTEKGTKVDEKGCPIEASKTEDAAPPAKALPPHKHGARTKAHKITEPLPAIPDTTPTQPAAGMPPPDTAAISMAEPVKPVAVPKVELTVAPVASAVVPEVATPAELQAEADRVEAQRRANHETALSRLAQIADMPTPSKKNRKKPAEKAAKAESSTTELDALVAPEPESKPLVPAIKATPKAKVKSAHKAEPKTEARTEITPKAPEPVAKVEPVAPPPPPVVELPRFVVLNFAAGTAELNVDSLRKLDALAKAIQEKRAEKPNLRLEIQAHANSKDGRRPGDVAQNRANMVRVYLDAQGIAKNRITLSTQLDGAASAEEERDSRRVEIKVLD
jgi:outer membrane protein OmpA-like peptidoglycan-associated protein